MQIKTSKGKTYEANFAFAPTTDGNCMVEIVDKRPIAEIAAEFDGVGKITREDADEGKAEYEGYTVLTSVVRNVQRGTVLIGMAKEVS